MEAERLKLVQQLGARVALTSQRPPQAMDPLEGYASPLAPPLPAVTDTVTFGLCFATEFLDTPDVVALSAASKVLRGTVFNVGMAAGRAWSTVRLDGFWPFGYKPMVTSFTPGGEMVLPPVLHTIVRRAGPIVEAFQSRDCFAHDATLALVARRCPNLTSVDVSQSPHRFLPQTPVFPSAVTGAGVASLHHLRHLRSISVQYAKLADGALRVLGETTPSLTALDVSHCTGLSEAGFLHLLPLPNVQSMVAVNTAVTDFAIANMVLAFEALEVLNVSYCTQVSNGCLLLLAKMLRGLVAPADGKHVATNATLSTIKAAMAADGVTAAGSGYGGPSVESALVSAPGSFMPEGMLAGAGDSLTSAGSFAAASVADVVPPGLPSGGGGGGGSLATNPIKVQFRLRRLGLRSVAVNHVALSLLSTYFPDVTHLDLSRSRHLNTLPFRALTLTCTSLESVELAGCSRVDDASLVLLVSGASRASLTKLNLAGCAALTDVSILSLASNATRVRDLNLVDCVHLTDASVTELKSLVLMTHLHLGSTASHASLANPDVTPTGVNRLMNCRAIGYRLRVLRLYNNAVNDLVLSTVGLRCHQLVELYVQDAPVKPLQRASDELVWEGAGVDEGGDSVTPRGLYHLLNGICTSLTRLQLVSCASVGYEGMVKVVEAPPNRLRHLQFRQCLGVGMRSYRLLAASDFGRHQLRSLSVCDDPASVNMESLGTVLQHCTRLDFLEVRACGLIAPWGAVETQALVRAAPRMPPLVEWLPQASTVEPVRDVP